MPSVSSFFGKFFGRTISDAAGYGIGTALEKPLEPVLQELTNETWRTATAAGATVPLGAGEAAQIVAEAVELGPWGADQAAQTGIGGEQFGALVQAVLNAPGVSELLTLWRRGFIDQAAFEHGLRKTRLEKQWDGALEALKDQPIAPAVAALAAVRGLIDDEGTLPVGPPAEEGKVPKFPVYPISGKAAAAAQGLSEDAYAVMVGINGRPMSLHEAASAYFRGIIELADYQRAVSEGDTRNEWRDAILDQARQILTAHDGIEDHLRGWSDQAAMYAQTARHGMSQDDTDVLFRIAGRPLSWHQVFIGLRRGGKYDGPVADLDPAFLKALQESNIRPEWYNLAWSQRYTYPSAFVLRSLTQAGTLSQSDTEQILLFEGWEPTLAKQVSSSWAGAPSTAVKPKKLTNATVRAAFRKGNITREAAVADLEANGLTATDAAIYLDA